jgi:ubiquinone/menaquinone biosynthesis C-methylase UbiE
MYEQVKNNLCQSYDRTAAECDQAAMTAWKVEERGLFLAWLQKEGKRRLLEIGAGPGRDSLFFQDNGLEVTCTDLSPEMVKLCQAKGLTAYVMDFLNLDFPDSSFGAVYSLNCLLHVPKQDLPGVLAAVQRLMKPTGLFYYGVYGGKDSEGAWEGDTYQPQRFFAFYTDEQIKKVVAPFFKPLYFKHIPVEGKSGLDFQSL